MKSFCSIITLTLFCSVLCIGQEDQTRINGLKFSKAFFISLKAYDIKSNVAIDTQIKIEKGKVWNVTSVKSFMIKEDLTPYENEVSLWLDEQVIDYYKVPFNTPLWLPEGVYRIRMKTKVYGAGISYISYLSGIEYSIE